MRPVIEILIATKNRPRLLRRALDSALRQSFREFAVIVIDDGEGAAATVAQALSERGLAAEHVAVVDNRGRGQVPARNLGLSRACGEIIAFLDDDDYWAHGNYLDSIARAMAKGAGATYGSGRIVVEDADMTIVDSLDFAAHSSRQSILQDNAILISGFAFRRLAWRELGEFDESLPYYWDWDWYLRLYQAGVEFENLGDAGICISARADTVSSQSYDWLRRDNLARLAAKHGLGPLRLRNHESIARDQRRGD